MQVVILGGNGYLGHNLIQRWLKQDPQVTFTVLVGRLKPILLKNGSTMPKLMLPTILN